MDESPDSGGAADEPESPRPSTAFTIEFDARRSLDTQRFESLVRKSEARHRRAHSTSATQRRDSTARRPPLSADLPRKRRDETSKSPIVDSIVTARRSLELPLRPPPVSDDVQMIADTSSPELELPTPGTPATLPSARDDDGAASPSSTVSEAGTYTVEADNYTEEQKAKMNIDDAFNVSDFAEPIRRALDEFRRAEADARRRSDAVTEEPSFANSIREELLLAESIPDPIRKVSTDKNVLEISCCYESPTEANESTRSYLDRIKSRVKHIGERTFRKTPKTPDSTVDVGSFTSVTASGVFSSTKLDDCLSKSQTTCRDNLVLQNVTNDSFTPSPHDVTAASNGERFNDSDGTTERMLIGRLSHLSLNRCQGDKSWIQEWADSVKKHNIEAGLRNTVGDARSKGLPPISPKHSVIVKGITSPSKSSASPCSSPTKMPSPVSTMMRQRAPVPDILTSTPDTESYLQNTQNVISNLQAKLQNAKSSPLANFEYNQNLFQEKINASKLPISQLNRSNSLNYRLYRKTSSAESSPLRNPGNYLVTGTHNMSSNTKLLLTNFGASKSLDTEPNVSPVIEAYYSPIHKYDQSNVFHSHLNVDNEFGNTQNGLSPTKERIHLRHHSFDGRNVRECFNSFDPSDDDFSNANMTQSLNLKSSTKYYCNDNEERRFTRKSSINNASGQKFVIDQRNVLSPGNQRLQNVKLSHHRGLSDTCTTNQTNKNQIHNHQRNQPLSVKQESPIRRSSSFNVVNKINTYDKNILASPRISSTSKTRNICLRPQDKMQLSCDFSLKRNTPETDGLSEDSDNVLADGFYSDCDRRSIRKSNANNLLVGARCNRAFALRRARLESPDARPQQNLNSNSPRFSATPEMKRKFAGDQNKKPIKTHSRDSRSTVPVSRIPDERPDVCQVQPADSSKNLKNKKASESMKQSLTNRLTRSSSAAKDFLPKSTEKVSSKKPMKINQNQLAKEIEFTNWKKRASYDPMKAALEGKKKLVTDKVKLSDIISNHQAKMEDAVSPSNSSPVHRSQSFNCTNTAIDERLYMLQQIQNEGSSDTDDFEDRLICTLPADGSTNVPILKMISASENNSDILLKIENAPDVTKRSKGPPQHNQIKLAKDYITSLQISQGLDFKKSTPIDKRRTYLIDPDNGDFDSLIEADKRRTYILDSDTTTNSTTNGSGSRRNSSIYSDDRVNVDKQSESEAESDTEPIVNVVHRTKSRSVPPQQRHSGDFSLSSSTCSGSKDTPSTKKYIQPRYLDISRFKNDSTSQKNFLRRDPTKTYVSVLPDQKIQAKKITAKQIEKEQKTKELEKWKRRASYDPRKSAAAGKQKTTITKSPSNSVLRSQSFHGPMLQNTKMAANSSGNSAVMFYHDMSSDNDF